MAAVPTERMMVVGGGVCSKDRSFCRAYIVHTTTAYIYSIPASSLHRSKRRVLIAATPSVRRRPLCAQSALLHTGFANKPVIGLNGSDREPQLAPLSIPSPHPHILFRISTPPTASHHHPSGLTVIMAPKALEGEKTYFAQRYGLTGEEVWLATNGGRGAYR